MASAICWKCGKDLSNIITPVSRREECSACRSDIHACKMCVYFDASNRTGCDEERAEYIVDKERANFCEYYTLSSRAFDETKLDKQRQAKAQLAALFADEDSVDEKQLDKSVISSFSDGNVEDSNTQAADLHQEETPAQAAERKLRDLLNQ
ncbi:hypothetical protein [Paraglaciecola sp. 20A4]|uniref:hypothetical protein n=1 Tax=Paraglaciecola sp. 20A4 TaxID=2687288 RepID=UPI0014084771|nr:hypothetical protein [Paraglaciecola sp. 20A4]